MGFGTELQSVESHEHINNVQYFEIKLFQSIKQFISQRIKGERQYAQSLLESVAIASKFDTQYSGFTSPFHKVNDI